MKIKWYQFWKWQAEIKKLEEEIIEKKTSLSELKTEKNNLTNRVETQLREIFRLKSEILKLTNSEKERVAKVRSKK